jgi:bacteriochlorophyll C20 methyltransferase
MADLSERFFMKLADAVKGKVDLTSVVPYPPTTPEESLYYETIHRSNVYYPIKLMQDHAMLEGVQHMVDVGGGIGDIAAAMCQQFPALNVTLINLPSAIELVKENAASKGLADRITPVAMDMYKEPYPTCDALMFARILYPMNEQFCTMMCQKAFQVLAPGGRILILDLIISDPDAPNYDYLTHYICAIGLNFSVLDFKSHTIYPDVLRRVGFEDVTMHEVYEHVLYQAVKPRS